MVYVIDTSIIISVILNEEHKPSIIKLTEGTDLMAPSSLHWEIGNAFSSMIKRGRITLEDARTAVDEYYNIPVKFMDIDLKKTLDLSKKLNIYAYDAYFIQCALENQYPLITLDRSLINNAKSTGVEIMIIESQ